MMATDSQNTKQDPNETTTTNKRLEQHLPIAKPPIPPHPPHPARPRANMMLCNICFFRFEGIFKAFSYKVY